jgi:hypothetical protein
MSVPHLFHLHHLLLTIYIVVVIVLLIRFSRRPPKVDRGTGDFVLAHGPVLKILGLVFLVLVPGGIIVLVMYHPPKNSAELYGCLGMTFGFAVLGLALTLEAKFTQVRFSESGVSSRTVWTGTKHIDWSELMSVQYSTLNTWFVLVGVHGTRIRVSQWLVGINAFLLELRRRVDSTKLVAAQKGFDAVLGGSGFPPA